MAQTKRTFLIVGVVLAMLAVFLFVFASITRAWDCVPGVQDSLEAQQAGLCVEVGQPLPTLPPASSFAQLAAPSGPQPGRPPGEVCHYEPSTGAWSTRPHYGDERQGTDEWPMKPGLCDQHHPTAVPTVAPTRTPTPTAVPVPTGTPAPTAPPIEIVGVQSTPEPTMVPEIEPESTPEPVPAPYQLPSKQKGSTQ